MTAFERLYFRLAEITEIVNLATAQGKKKSEVISMIKERFQDLSDISESSFNNYIYTFPIVFNELNKIKQENLALQVENESIKQQLNTSLNNLETAIQDKEIAISELNSIKQSIKHSEVNGMNGLNNELNSALNMPTDTDKFAIFRQETEQKFVELNNRIKQIESNEQAIKQIKQTVKQKGLNNVGKWNIVESGGYYRAFRNINGKNIGIYIGREFTEENAREKITAKGYSVDG